MKSDGYQQPRVDVAPATPQPTANEFREVDLSTAEAELRLRLSEVDQALASADAARVVRQQALEFKFSV